MIMITTRDLLIWNKIRTKSFFFTMRSSFYKFSYNSSFITVHIVKFDVMCDIITFPLVINEMNDNEDQFMLLFFYLRNTCI